MLQLAVILSSITFIFTLSVKDGLVGESVSLTCSFDIYNDYPINWYYKDRDLYLTTDGTIYTNVPNAIKDRLSVECSRYTGYNDVCTLNINPLMQTDNGTYECRYYDSVNNKGYYFDSVKLNVSYGHLPSEESPICDIGINGRYMLPTGFSVGDEIDLRCAVEGSSLSPSIYWVREQDDITTDLTLYVKGKILFQKLNLTEEDIGAVFTCFMKHPALPARKNCSITPLLAASPTTKSRLIIQTTIRTQANRYLSQPYIPVTASQRVKSSAKTSNPEHDFHTSNRSQNPTNLPVSSDFFSTPEEISNAQQATQSQQTFMLLVIIAILVVLVLISTTVSVVVWKNRHNQSVVSVKPEECSAATNAPITTHNTNYIELNLSEIKPSTYEELKTPSMNDINAVDQEYESPNFPDE